VGYYCRPRYLANWPFSGQVAVELDIYPWCPVSSNLARRHLADLRRVRLVETASSRCLIEVGPRWLFSRRCLIEVGPRWPFSRWCLTQSGLPSGDSAGIEGLHSGLTNLMASVGPRCSSRPRRTELECLQGISDTLCSSVRRATSARSAAGRWAAGYGFLPCAGSLGHRATTPDASRSDSPFPRRRWRRLGHRSPPPWS
jgi:hypothetical protein